MLSKLNWLLSKKIYHIKHLTMTAPRSTSCYNTTKNTKNAPQIEYRPNYEYKIN